MIRKAITFVVVAGALTVALVASSAIAGNVLPSGPGADASPCPAVGGPDSCFTVNLAPGETAKYKGPLADTMMFADCCAEGDTLVGKASGPSSRGAIRWTSSGVLDAGCDDPWPHPDTHSLTIAGGATRASVKLISSPFDGTGVYVGMTAPGWVQVAGPPDPCFGP